MQRIKTWFFRQLHKNGETAGDALSCSVLASSMGIFLCLVCLVGLTWAWFFDSTQSACGTIVAANFSADITVTASDTNVQAAPLTAGEYEIDPAAVYTVTLQVSAAQQETTASQGFYKIDLTQAGSGATVYYTAIFEKGEAFTFTVAAGFTHLSFTPMWGELPAAAESYTVANGGTIPPALSAVYVPAPVTAPAPAAATPSDQSAQTGDTPQESGSDADESEPQSEPQTTESAENTVQTESAGGE